MRTLYLSYTNGSESDLPGVYRRALEDVTSLTVQSSRTRIPDDRALDLLREHDAYLVCRNSAPVPADLAREAGRLSLVCAVVGSLRDYVPIEIIRSNIAVTNWGDAPATHIAEGAMALLLATLKDLHHHVADKRRGSWKIAPETHGGRLEGHHVGLYGLGFIGRRFVDMLEPFGPIVHVYDPYAASVPANVIREDSLEALFSKCSVIAIHAGLTDETRHSVTADLLRLLPDYGVVINTARGAIIDQTALFHELESGRLRAGLDVLEPDSLPVDHPARSWENCILTSHQVHLDWPRGDDPPTELTRAQRYSIENLARFKNGKALNHLVDYERYSRMT
jgi:phosphoglycerate dehydrogenase-like enzyme